MKREFHFENGSVFLFSELRYITAKTSLRVLFGMSKTFSSKIFANLRKTLYYAIFVYLDTFKRVSSKQIFNLILSIYFLLFSNIR